MEKKVQDELGATIAEYALLIWLIAVVAVAVIIPLGPIIRDMFQQLANGF